MNGFESSALIERYVAALNASDHEAALACLSDDVVHDMREGVREIGREKFRWRLGLSARSFRESIADLLILTAQDGGRAAAEFTLRGEYLSSAEGFPAASGQRYSVPAGMFFEIEDGRISRVTSYLNAKAWIAALSA